MEVTILSLEMQNWGHDFKYFNKIISFIGTVQMI